MEKFTAFWKAMTPDGRVAFSDKIGTTVGYVNKAISVGQIFGAKLCVSIERETFGAITRKDLRADWRDLWPELAKKAA